MQSLFTLLTQWSVKAWAAAIVAVFSCSAATVFLFYFSWADAGSNSTPGNPTNPTVAGPVGHPGGTLGSGHCTAPLPIVPEANAGLVLIPVTAAMLFVSSRRLWRVKVSLPDDSQSTPSESNS